MEAMLSEPGEQTSGPSFQVLTCLRDEALNRDLVGMRTRSGKVKGSLHTPDGVSGDAEADLEAPLPQESLGGGLAERLERRHLQPRR